MDIFDKCVEDKRANLLRGLGIYPYFRSVSSAQEPVVQHEGRELIYAVVTGEANHARLDDILADHARLYDPRGLAGVGARDDRLVAVESLEGDEPEIFA